MSNLQEWFQANEALHTERTQRIINQMKVNLLRMDKNNKYEDVL